MWVESKNEFVDFVGKGIKVIICGLVVLIKYCGWSVNEFVDEYVRLLDNVLINQQSYGGGSDLWNITPETTKVNNKCGR